MKKTMLSAMLLSAAVTAGAQGNNTGMGGHNCNYKSLAEKVAKLEKKTDAFNLYFNYATSFRVEKNSLNQNPSSGFANKQLRIEMKGNLGDHLFYRFRHRLNKADQARSQDNFSKATDIMMAGWKFNDKLTVQAGKMCQIWGGFEFDENPMYIYQYSDMVDNMDNFMAGIAVSYKPVPSQELALGISDTDNDKLSDIYGNPAYSVEAGGKRKRVLQQANHPITYIANWNGSFFGGILNTRWSWGIQTQAQHKYSRMLILGQQLNLPRFQWYLDYMGAFDGVDRLGIATSELKPTFDGKVPTYCSDVHYNSFITKANWQFMPQWNLMLKGMYEMADVTKTDKYRNYRKSFGYMGSVEYYPVKDQDFRLFLAYVGRQFKYSNKSGLKDYNTNRVELGFMYRIKAF